MARVKGGLNAKKRHNRVLKLAKGYRGARSKQYRVAKQSVMRALTSSYAGRKERKRQFRQLWIARINAAARINGLSYSKFMYGLKLAGVEMNRKVLSDMAISDAEGFAKLACAIKEKNGKNIWCYTGYLYDEQLLNDSRARCEYTDEMLSMLDVLVDGEFVEALKDIRLVFRGSSNQRVIDVKKSLGQNEIVMWQPKVERGV